MREMAGARERETAVVLYFSTRLYVSDPFRVTHSQNVRVGCGLGSHGSAWGVFESWFGLRFGSSHVLNRVKIWCSQLRSWSNISGQTQVSVLVNLARRWVLVQDVD
ncbi:hypothetical protein HanRHA438_Chr11g0506051 [Helianthus annuus]|uniref:Uncharacterized protein n=1 Tax=Helianthus annuus TaxID=4232 RepID=A0A251UKZ2_HELAN|nr:hypothetical protein HanXRQr2_Chr11g0493441 [Helianthus annuus]KAF5782243.1 hypothetical protein HanXRQr2_Chr11g0493451 [Helianthus annuus]KAJ0501746.1 hypothetical protein HanHA300_Chr11g0404491 [Helianthus annuus]KAJ0501747.1 hypothetical protein HanHA300_Chr11g0404501 [Helianthus annuus]KAJ0509642.1 hypothetical protein HanIR_Chr11g0531301 [Helianthus annuus]